MGAGGESAAQENEYNTPQQAWIQTAWMMKMMGVPYQKGFIFPQ